MKQIVRYRYLTVPNKMFVEVRITVDENSRVETKNAFDTGTSTNLMFLPMINVQLLKPAQVDETGRKFRPIPSQQDSIGLTKFTYPIFLTELKEIYDGMKTQDVFVYTGDRLDLNAKVADNIRRAFMIGRNAIEFSATVIEQQTESGDIERLEGIKIKFNNEDSTVLLTVREVESLIWLLNKADIDSIVFTMYLNFIDRRNNYNHSKPVVDIKPMSKAFYSQKEKVAYASIPEKPAEENKNKEVTQSTVIEIPKEDIPSKYKLESDEVPFEQAMNLPQ